MWHAETMWAITVSRPGGPEVLVPVRRPVPEPKAGEVLIRIAGAGSGRFLRSAWHGESAHLPGHLFVAAFGTGWQAVRVYPFGQKVENDPALRTGKFVDWHTLR